MTKHPVTSNLAVNTAHVSPSNISAETNPKPDSQMFPVLKEVKNYILSLLMRTYSLVVLIFFIALIVFLLPKHLFFIEHTHRLFLILIDLEMYFVPIFFILIDKEMFQFTKKMCQGLYRSFMLKDHD